MSEKYSIPETNVLAIASHVVYGYVGNKMATFVMQSMGCDVAALNTVQFSNHTAYKQTRGTKTSAEEIRDIYDGLKQSYLTNFTMMLSGYAPSAEAVQAVGTIGRDLKLQASTKSGSFFWVLDPVMGDEGKIYVNEDVVPMYKNLLCDADLILPNQFEAELLSDIKVISLSTLAEAVTKLHEEYRVPHVIVTSVRLDRSSPNISVVGSTRRSDGSPRLFKTSVPLIDCFFSGTGDMFAALTVVRLREAALAASLTTTKSWVSPDNVEATELPLAKAVEKVLASMQAVLERTKDAMHEELKALNYDLGALDKESGSAKRVHLRETKAAEVRIVRNVDLLKNPKIVYRVEAFDISAISDNSIEELDKDDGSAREEQDDATEERKYRVAEEGDKGADAHEETKEGFILADRT